MASMVLTMFRRLRAARRNRQMSLDEFKAMKLAKFRKLVEHAQRHSPYYAQIIADHGIDVARCVPTDFPVLTKGLLMANFDRIVTVPRITKAAVAEFLTRSTDPNELLFDEYRVVHTSGSSGEIGYFLYSKQDWMVGMTQALGRGRRPERARPRRFGRVRVAYYAAVGGHFAGVSMVSMGRRGLARLFSDVQLFEINSPLPTVIERLNRFQPDVLAGYTGGLRILAEQQQAGNLKIAPLGIGTAGEAMSPTDKRILEDAFGCRASNGYGSTEFLMMGGLNPDGQTMSLCNEELTYELFEDHTLITNLYNYTQPLIRYRMSDILRPVVAGSEETPNFVVHSLIGRSEMMPKFVNRDGAEDFISPHTINEVFVAGVLRFQMRLIDKTHFRFAVILEPSLSVESRATTLNALRERLREILDQKAMNNVTFEIEPVDELPVDARTGKFKLIVAAAA